MFWHTTKITSASLSYQWIQTQTNKLTELEMRDFRKTIREIVEWIDVGLGMEEKISFDFSD